MADLDKVAEFIIEVVEGYTWNEDLPLPCECEEVKKEIVEILEEQFPIKYKNAYEILIPYFPSISDEEQPKVHAQLQKLGL